MGPPLCHKGVPCTAFRCDLDAEPGIGVLRALQSRSANPLLTRLGPSRTLNTRRWCVWSPLYLLGLASPQAGQLRPTTMAAASASQGREGSIKDMIARFRSSKPTNREDRAAMRESGSLPAAMWWQRESNDSGAPPPPPPPPPGRDQAGATRSGTEHAPAARPVLNVTSGGETAPPASVQTDSAVSATIPPTLPSQAAVSRTPDRNKLTSSFGSA
jgi:hypothetical protein